MSSKAEFFNTMYRVLDAQGIPASRINKTIQETIEERYLSQVDYQDTDTLAEDAALDVQQLLDYERRKSRGNIYLSKKKQENLKRGDAENRRLLEVLRSSALQTYYGQRIKSDPRILAFRTAFLEGKTISSKEKVLTFLRSPANRYITTSRMRELGISFINNSTEILKDEICYDSSCSRSNIKHPTPVRLIELQFSHSNITVQTNIDVISDAYNCLNKLQYLTSTNTGESKVREVDCFPGSAIDAIRILCNELLHDYSLIYSMIPWLILMDSSVPIQPIQSIDPIGDADCNTVTLRIASWMSSATVEKYYKRIQQQILGCHSRPLAKKTLELFRFISEHGEPSGKDGRWKKLYNEWNIQYPAWSYSNIRQFQRDYNERAKKPLIGPRVAVKEAFLIL